MLPAFRQLPGFMSYAGGFDRAAQRGVAVTVWETVEQAAGGRTALGSMVQQFEALGVRFEPGQVYELLRQI